MDVLDFEERGEDTGRRVRGRAKRGVEFVRKSLLLHADRTLAPTPLSHGDYLRVAKGKGACFASPTFL